MEKLVRIRLPAIPRERAITTKGQSRALTLSLTRPRALIGPSLIPPPSTARSLPPSNVPHPRAHTSLNTLAFPLRFNRTTYGLSSPSAFDDANHPPSEDAPAPNSDIVCVCRVVYPVWLPDSSERSVFRASNESVCTRLRFGSRARGDSRASVWRPGDRSTHPTAF